MRQSQSRGVHHEWILVAAITDCDRNAVVKEWTLRGRLSRPELAQHIKPPSPLLGDLGRTILDGDPEHLRRVPQAQNMYHCPCSVVMVVALQRHREKVTCCFEFGGDFQHGASRFKSIEPDCR